MAFLPTFCLQEEALPAELGVVSERPSCLQELLKPSPSQLHSCMALGSLHIFPSKPACLTRLEEEADRRIQLLPVKVDIKGICKSLSFIFCFSNIVSFITIYYVH